jgi:hypothetical protein
MAVVMVAGRLSGRNGSSGNEERGKREKNVFHGQLRDFKKTGVASWQRRKYPAINANRRLTKNPTINRRLFISTIKCFISF